MITNRRSSIVASALVACAFAMGVQVPVSAAPFFDEHPSPLSKLQELGSRASDVALQAVNMVGIRYKYGGNSPELGLDCSGLVRYVFKQAWGKDLPRTARDISQVGQKVDDSSLKPGDLVFYNTLKRGFSHVGIYLGDNKFIHSPARGGEVRIENMDQTYWRKRFNGARRIDQPEDPGTANPEPSK